MRLRTNTPIPPPSAFLFKNQLSTLKAPYKIHIVANTLIQQALGFGMISWIQGFSDLRAISLCIVDAALTAPVVVGILNVVLFAQIGATGLLLARFVLERRIALNSGSDVSSSEKTAKRSDTMRTFGFDSASPLTRPPLLERRTADLLGQEDSQIGQPFDTKKLGSQEVDVHPGKLVVMSPDPFADPGQQQQGNSGDRRISLFPRLRPTHTVSNRPSSEVLGQQNRVIDYTPPKAGEQDLGGGSPGPTVNRFASYSRPRGATKTSKTELDWDRDLKK